MGAGKSTLFRQLQHIYRDDPGVGFVDEPSFTECSLMHRVYDPLHEIYKQPCQGNYVCGQLHINKTLSDAYDREALDREVIVMDRWVWSCRHFIAARESFLSPFALSYLLTDVREKHLRFLQRLNPGVQIRRFYLNTSPEQCYENILKRDRKEEIGCTKAFWLDFNTRFGNEVLHSDGACEIFATASDVCQEMLSFRTPAPSRIDLVAI